MAEEDQGLTLSPDVSPSWQLSRTPLQGTSGQHERPWKTMPRTSTVSLCQTSHRPAQIQHGREYRRAQIQHLGFSVYQDPKRLEVFWVPLGYRRGSGPE